MYKNEALKRSSYIMMIFAYLFGMPFCLTALDIEIDNQSGHNVFIKFTGDDLDVDKNNQSIEATKSETFNLSKVSSGRIYISYDKALSSDAPDGANSNDDDYYTRFDKVELTYDGGGKINLTAVDFYAIPLMLQTFINSVPIDQFSLKQQTTGNELKTKLLATAQDKSVEITKDGKFVRLLSPKNTTTSASYPSMESYVNSAVGKTLSIKGTYFGTPAEDYNYTGTISKTDIALTMSGKDSITIPVVGLAGIDPNEKVKDSYSIYTCNGVYYRSSAPTTPVQPGTKTSNDLYSAVYRDVIAAFNFGYINGNYGDDSSKWWTNTPFASANSSGHYNKYAAEIYENYPGAYGFPFSDRQRHVLADLGNKVDKVKITILGDDTKPTYETIPGSHNPTTGDVGFNAVLVFANDIEGKEFTFGSTTCKAGWNNDYSSGPEKDTGNGKAAQVNNVLVTDGYNKYDLIIGSNTYTVIAYVKDKTVQWGSIAGGGNANWSSPNLFIGGLQTNSFGIHVSHGSTFTLSNSDLILKEGKTSSDMVFTKPAKVYVLYGDDQRKVPIKVLTKIKSSTDVIDCLWKHKISLINKKVIGKDQTAAEFILEHQNYSVEGDVYVEMKNASGETETYFAANIAQLAPFISSIKDQDGQDITSLTAGETVVVNGTFFGIKPPVAGVEYVAGNGKVKLKRCKVLKPLKYADEKGREGKSCMDLNSATGVSQVTIKLPKKLPNGTIKSIIVYNGIGYATIYAE